HLYYAAGFFDDNMVIDSEGDNSESASRPAYPSSLHQQEEEAKSSCSRSPSPAPSFHYQHISSPSYRSDLTDFECLEHDMQSFDFAIAGLIPQDHPSFPPRIVKHLEPGCYDCWPGEAHPLPLLPQCRHDLHSLGNFLFARANEWNDLMSEVSGSGDAFVAHNAGDGLFALSNKMLDLAWGVNWTKLEKKKWDGDGVEKKGAADSELMQAFEKVNGKIKRQRRGSWVDLRDSDEDEDAGGPFH
ncbi:MAG: hypothetical protein Q9168_008268, partial [Polycauliona sp. 1 TL-2023]